MPEAPDVDGRDREALLAHAASIAPAYTTEWTPDLASEESDPGTTVLRLFAAMAEDVVERLDRVPEKQRLAFYDALGFERKPPVPARVPVTVRLDDGAEANVVVPGGTQAIAEPEAGPERVFEVESSAGIEATPAQLQSVLSVAPAPGRDLIVDHAAAIGGGASTRLFDAGPDGERNRQEHALYVGHADQFDVESGSIVRVTIDTAAPEALLREHLEWSYYGTGGGEDDAERWRPLSIADAAADGGDPIVVEADWELQYEVDPLEPAGPLLPAATVPSVTLAFEVDGSPTERTVDGVESRWIRCRLPESIDPSEVDLHVGSELGQSPENPVRIESRAPTSREPDWLFQNDVPLPTAPAERAPGRPIRPFGDHPRERDVFYVASEEAFSKAGATATVSFEGPGAPSAPTADERVLSWEYWNGDGWAPIDSVDDRTDALRTGDDVSFTVPPDLEPTSVSGHEAHWIRVRLVSGDYGTVTFLEEPDGTWKRDPSNLHPPAYDDVRITYDATDPVAPAHLLTENNRSFGPDLAADGVASFEPFVDLPDERQTLYLGFDAPLEDGPISLLVTVAEAAYPEAFHPQLRWEYVPESAPDEWHRVTVRDDTEGLTVRGTVEFGFPEPSAARSLFGRELHWVRARVTGTAFEAPESDGAASETDGAADRSDPASDNAASCVDGSLRPCGERIRTPPPGGQPARDAPVLEGVYPNATWAEDRRTIERELLGSSDGERDQSFAVASPPVASAAVWVDELQALSDGRRRALRESTPDRVEVETDDEGEPTAFWVRWERVPDFLDSDGDDRHYVLAGTRGRVAFGDGERGRIPPRGRENVRITYATGGGAAGNVGAGAISGFKRSVEHVDAVTNPVPADGGADAESTADVRSRAPAALRDRNRAVSAGDVERIASDAARQVARANCLPATDRAGERAPGWATLLIVPDAGGPRPTPSVTLREQVSSYVSERAPATLVHPDRLVVRGPSYVPVSVETDLIAGEGATASTVEERVRSAVETFLHPLEGGDEAFRSTERRAGSAPRDGDSADESAAVGWQFGELPCVSDVYARLEAVAGVDHVEALRLRIAGADEVVTLRPGDEAPSVSSDALVCSGTHDVSARLEPAAAAGGDGR